MSLFQALPVQHSRQTRYLAVKEKALPPGQRFFCLCNFYFTTVASSTTLNNWGLSNYYHRV
jgi:hypothetical protein